MLQVLPRWSFRKNFYFMSWSLSYSLFCSDVKDHIHGQLIVCYMLHLISFRPSVIVYMTLYFEVFIYKCIYILVLKKTPVYSISVILHPRWLSGKESACQCRSRRSCEFDPWLGISPVGGNGNPLQYPCQENPLLQSIGSQRVRHN